MVEIAFRGAKTTMCMWFFLLVVEDTENVLLDAMNKNSDELEAISTFTVYILQKRRSIECYNLPTCTVRIDRAQAFERSETCTAAFSHPRACFLPTFSSTKLITQYPFRAGTTKENFYFS